MGKISQKKDGKEGVPKAEILQGDSLLKQMLPVFSFNEKFRWPPS